MNKPSLMQSSLIKKRPGYTSRKFSDNLRKKSTGRI